MSPGPARTRLRGLTWDHTRGYGPMAVTSQIFADRRPGVEIAWDRRSLWAFGEQPLHEVAAAYDLLVIDHPMVARAAREGLLLPLDEQLPAADLDPLRTGTVGGSQHTYHVAGHDYALAIDAACQVAVSRPDLLRQLEAVTPTTWAAVLDLARRSRKVGLPLNAVDVFSSFLTLCAHLGEPAAARGVDRFVDREVGREALATLTELAALVPRWCAEANPIAVLIAMASADEIAYVPLLFGYTNYSRAGYAPHRLAFHDIPCLVGGVPRGSCLGGAGLAVSASSKRRELALEYAGWVARPRLQRTEYVRAGGQPAAVAAWDDEEANRMTGGFFRSTRASIDRAYVRPHSPGFPPFQTEAAVLLREAVLSGAGGDEVLRRLDDRYRRSLGAAG